MTKGGVGRGPRGGEDTLTSYCAGNCPRQSGWSFSNFFPYQARLLEGGEVGSGHTCGGPGQVRGLTSRAEACEPEDRRQEFTVRARAVNYLRSGEWEGRSGESLGAGGWVGIREGTRRAGRGEGEVGPMFTVSQRSPQFRQGGWSLASRQRVGLGHYSLAIIMDRDRRHLGVNG